ASTAAAVFQCAHPGSLQEKMHQAPEEGGKLANEATGSSGGMLPPGSCPGAPTCARPGTAPEADWGEPGSPSPAAGPGVSPGGAQQLRSGLRCLYARAWIPGTLGPQERACPLMSQDMRVRQRLVVCPSTGDRHAPDGQTVSAVVATGERSARLHSLGE